MSLSYGEKAHRALKLLLGLRKRAIAGALAGHGLGQADIEEGWTLLKEMGAGKLEALPPAGADTTLLDDLDAWENRWFPIAGACLRRRFPDIHARVFLNLSQSRGIELALSVGCFVDRIDGLTAGGPDGAAARELLSRRGLTDGVLAQARTMLERLRRPMEPDGTEPDPQHEQRLERAEAALWAWYLEWSQIARTAIKSRPMLRMLGFLGGRGHAEEAGAAAASAPHDE
jgi:hypothetical protein